MKRAFITISLIGLSLGQFYFQGKKGLQAREHYIEWNDTTTVDPRIEAFQVLDAKCNVCHRRQNPFKVFSLKNMKKHAPKIHEQVFVKRRMPKGNEIRLTEEEFKTLENWLKTQNIK